MNIALSELLPYITAALGGVAGWLWRKLEAVQKAHTDFRTHVAEKYVTKDDMKMSIDRVYASLDRIEKKLDERR